MTALTELFGVWTLVPERCTYAEGVDLPSTGVYTLLVDPEDGARVFAHARWRAAQGPTQEAAFHLQLDGVAHPFGADADQLALRSEYDAEAGELRSELLRAGAAIHRARRRLDEDGGLRVLQASQAEHEDGSLTWLENDAYYRRTGVKQVLVYRRDLKMRKGKIAAQCAHASMAVFFRRKRAHLDELVIPLDGPMSVWTSARFTKICLSLPDEEALLAAYEAAREAGLPCALITDAGKTEFHGVPTRTAIAIGPASNEEVDAITGPRGTIPGKLA